MTGAKGALFREQIRMMNQQPGVGASFATLNVAPQDVFVFRERQAVLVRLPSFEWDFTLGLRVHLRGNGRNLNTKQIGTGNHEGRPALLLSLEGEWADAQRVLHEMLDGGEVTVAVASR